MKGSTPRKSREGEQSEGSAPRKSREGEQSEGSRFLVKSKVSLPRAVARFGSVTTGARLAVNHIARARFDC
jgi:hypothetical protein